MQLEGRNDNPGPTHRMARDISLRGILHVRLPPAVEGICSSDYLLSTLSTNEMSAQRMANPLSSEHLPSRSHPVHQVAFIPLKVDTHVRRVSQRLLSRRALHWRIPSVVDPADMVNPVCDRPPYFGKESKVIKGY
jgi:hypothetical protein